MEIMVRREADGENIVDVGPISLILQDEVVNALHHVINQRLSQSSDADTAELYKKLEAYKKFATKIKSVDDRIIQRLAVKLKPEQLVTMTRLSEGQDLYQKVLRNLSKSNGMQFEEDYRALNKITVHQACVYMEQILPQIKQAAQAQKAQQV